MTRVAMESLTSNISVKRQTIDAWASVLNYEEWYRNRNSPRRYFFNMNVVGDLELISRKINLAKMYTWFLVDATRNNKAAIGLKDIDLAFFPMIKVDHFYVLVFNIKTRKYLSSTTNMQIPWMTMPYTSITHMQPMSCKC